MELCVFEYLDFRKFLNDYYELKRQTEKGFTHRKIGELGGFDPGLFSKVITGQRDISFKMMVKFLEAFPLRNEKEEEYFETLVQFNQAHTHSEKKFYLEKLLEMRESKIEKVVKNQYEFYDKWYYTALRELLPLVDFKDDYGALGKLLNPQVNARQVKKAVQLLLELGFVRKTEEGKYEVSQNLISSGYETKSVAVNNHVINCLELSRESLDRFANDQKNLSSITFTLPQNRFSEVEERVRAFRRELMSFVEQCEKEDRVYQINMQLFPVSESIHKQERRGRKPNSEKEGKNG